MSTTFKGGNGFLWVQTEGPNSQPRYLGCHNIDTIDIPRGDIELIYCPDPSGPDRFNVVGSIHGAAGAITTSITTDVTDELDYLEGLNCSFTLFVHMSKTGNRGVFTNFDRTFVLTNSRITSESLSNLTARQPDDNARSEQSFDISAETLLRLFEQTMSRQSISATGDIEDIAFANDQRCRTDEQTQLDSCQVGYAVHNISDGSPSGVAEVLYTSDGATWTASATDPFASSEVINGVEAFELSRDSYRVVVARGTTDGSNPAEIAYSDDNGATWTTVNVGSVNGQFIPSRFALFALDRNSIWLGTDDGYIYFSGDGGLSWTTQQEGAITSGNINSIHMIDENVGWMGGANNILARTIDGTAWSAVSGPAAQAGVAVTRVEVIDRNRVWVAYADGDLYYTIDGGTTWGTRSFSGSGTGEIRDLRFFGETLGYLAHNVSGSGTIHWTIDGGYTWQALSTPTNSGLNALSICTPWVFYVAGESNSATGYIAKATV